MEGRWTQLLNEHLFEGESNGDCVFEVLLHQFGPPAEGKKAEVPPIRDTIEKYE